MDADDLRLDGNSLGGLLGELFGREMTTALGTCASCGAVGEVATLVVYAQAPGTVGRCRTCGAVLLRVVRAERRTWIDLRGLRSLQLELLGEEP